MGGDAATNRMRPILLWSGLGLLLILAFAAALGAVQRSFYSPSGFVSGYVEALAAHDTVAALAMPGAAPTTAAMKRADLPTKASRELLRRDLLPRITDIQILSDTEFADGEHDVTVRVKADGEHVTSTFTVRPAGTVLGFLTTWEFAATPLTVARVTVAHAQTFTVGGHTVSPRAAAPDQPADAFNVTADYLLFAPARYTLGHRSTYLTAEPVALSGEPAQATEATVDTQPTQAFTSAVQKELDGFLDDCATQQVLQPTGCPFGVQINDRVQGTPTWTIASFPKVSLTAGPTAWTMGPTPGVAHLSVTVQSLFDGSVEQRESDEQFVVSLSSVTIRPDGSLDILIG